MTEKKPTLQTWQVTSYLSEGNAPYIEALYETYLTNPHSVSEEWRQYFQSLANGHPIEGTISGLQDVSHDSIRKQLISDAGRPRFLLGPTTSPVSEQKAAKQESVDQLISAYRRFGHLNAKIDPLASEKPIDSRLTLEHYHLSENDMGLRFATRNLLPQSQATLKEIYQTLRNYYSSSIGVEYTRIANEEEREWLREYIEEKLPAMKIETSVQRLIMQKLLAAETLEKYLDSKYKGQKRFSVEGADTLIPMLFELATQAAASKLNQIVIAMAHRGRLNVLLNVMGQSPLELFQEFEGTKDYGLTTGDVKYHRGFSSDINTEKGPIHLSLFFNPSHLEFVCPVTMGSTRARQERSENEAKFDTSMALMIHGDASFAGQGVVMETFSMSQTRAYCIGGSIHLILNNQIGFTTSDPRDTRSSYYCSDLSKMIDVPVFHVNADDPEAAIKIIRLALDYRMKFHKDVVIDLVCYRRHGHQEVDEPRATQPLMYAKIDSLPSVISLYSKKLIEAGACTEQELNQWKETYRDRLDQGRTVVELVGPGLVGFKSSDWMPYIGQTWTIPVDTTVPKRHLTELGRKITYLPQGFVLQRNVAALMEARRKMIEDQAPLDWGCAEMLAYASLLDQGYPVRLTGEDVRRGTFFHRHGTVFDQNTGEAYTSLAHISDNQASIQLYDSLLSEVGVVGFEYGYATNDPNALVIWEAQFGDFANVAQVIIDQFISSGAQKWNRLCGLVMLLPHGQEGMGPEHSSARLERYLQLCAQDNMQIFVPSTPAQMFHLLRRQILRPFRKPLIVFTPKSLLRHKLVVSSLDDLARGQLQLIIPEIEAIKPAKVSRIVICSGKIYYELLTKRREEKIEDIAIVRIEQMYPFPYDELKDTLAIYKKAKEVVWCQEEPKNQGAWFSIRHRIYQCILKDAELLYAGREPMAAPAGGYPSLHIKQQVDLINQALNLDENKPAMGYHAD